LEETVLDYYYRLVGLNGGELLLQPELCKNVTILGGYNVGFYRVMMLVTIFFEWGFSVEVDNSEG
jgi:hypothetical protein